jgi:large subunit ribosomal protein L5
MPAGNMKSIKTRYQQEIIAKMKERFGLTSDLAVPRILKVTINTGIGRIRQEKESVEEVVKDLTLISGQKPVFSQAKKAIASFKTRVGQPIGIKVTLRGQRMYDFLDRLVNLALPRTRDFRGLSESAVDQAGNLNIGIKEQIIFPEISHEHVRLIFGLEVAVTTNAGSYEKGLELFKLLGFPIKS